MMAEATLSAENSYKLGSVNQLLRLPKTPKLADLQNISLLLVNSDPSMITPQSASSLDLEAIENLRALGDDGDDTFLREIVELYLSDIPLRINDLKTARASEDRSLYVRSAHTVKGSSANVGTVEVRLLAERLEHRAKTDPLIALDSELEELEAAFVRAKTALQIYLG